MIEVKMLADSISEAGKRISTMQVKYHRFILPEANTHRVFSRNYSSSRAIPTAKLLQQVRTDPATPVRWGKNQAGMQAAEDLSGDALELAKTRWLRSAETAADMAELMSNSGVHKQIVNRILEPYLWVYGVITSTEWDNFFALRDHPDAQPEILVLAREMKSAMNKSKPTLLREGEWHLPYISEDLRNDSFFKSEVNAKKLRMISAARCCRVSYLKHDGTVPNVDEDLVLFHKLANANPGHFSPLEHQATPDFLVPTHHGLDAAWANSAYHGNLRGWQQFRCLWENNVG